MCVLLNVVNKWNYWIDFRRKRDFWMVHDSTKRCLLYVDVFVLVRLICQVRERTKNESKESRERLCTIFRYKIFTGFRDIYELIIPMCWLYLPILNKYEQSIHLICAAYIQQIQLVLYYFQSDTNNITSEINFEHLPVSGAICWQRDLMTSISQFTQVFAKQCKSPI